MTGEDEIKIDTPVKGRVLLRMRIGTGAASLTDSTPISLFAGAVSHVDAVCKPRWLTWLLPVDNVSQLTIKAEKPVRVYSIEVCKEIEHNRRVESAAPAGYGLTLAEDGVLLKNDRPNTSCLP